MAKVIPRFLSETEESLIMKSAAEAGRQYRADEYHVRELGRVGKSGARLLVVERDGTGIPYVVKLDKFNRIQRELRNLDEVSKNFVDARSPTRKPAHVGSLGAVVYPHMGAARPGRTHVRELKDVAYAQRADSGVVRAMTRLVGCLDYAHKDKEEGSANPVEAYATFLSIREADATQVIEQMLGDARAAADLMYLQAPIANPLVVLEKLKKAPPMRIYRAPIHGDLHPNNVILNPRDGVHLIDWAWAEKAGPALMDFVLMECSLRFMEFPSAVDLVHQCLVDQALLRPDGHDASALMAAPDPRLAPYYLRLGKVLEVWRRGARRVTADQTSFAEYLSAQFVVLFGLLKYPELNRPVALRALGLVGSELGRLGVV